MASKNIMIEKSVFQDLRNFRDENELASYTEAIKELLKFYRETTGRWFEGTIYRTIKPDVAIPIKHSATSPVSTDTEVSWQK